MVAVTEDTSGAVNVDIVSQCDHTYGCKVAVGSRALANL